MDSKFLNWLLGIRNEVLNRYMIAITHLGTGGAIWLFTVYILFYLGFRIESINVILALIFNGIVCNLLLKNILKRKRPSWITKVELLIKDPTDFSFPSGHASSSFAATLTIYFYFRGMGIFFLVIAALIALLKDLSLRSLSQRRNHRGNYWNIYRPCYKKLLRQIFIRLYASKSTASYLDLFLRSEKKPVIKLAHSLSKIPYS